MSRGRETEADRIARERQLQKEIQEKKQQSVEAHQKETTQENCIREVNEEIPRVLQLLADLGYPDMEELDVVEETPRLFGGYRQHRYTKAAWMIAEFEGYNYGDKYTGKIYLLSDGNISIVPPSSLALARSPQELKKPGFEAHLSKTCSGLKNLRQKLEAKLSK